MGWFRKQKGKVFCIGRNKTGTTSLAKFLGDHGYKMGNQPEAEMLMDAYAKRNWKPIIRYCRNAEAFQDVPFSLPYTYVALDHAFPGSKFILTKRDNPEQWFNSITRFHAKLFGNGQIPTKEDLQAARYRYVGYMWKVNRIVFSTPEEDLYNKELMIGHYNAHNQEVMNYFRFRNDLLIVNVSDESAVAQLCGFLDIAPRYASFPWENKT